ncbi:hypothetical protein G4Z16_00925 [Streptomyces bathyalis]|uniref:Uncharacterized protein n=1 Tax=Streptomyces bathyalis TaxID=2710756 RepID=A0A7T1WQH8_9ACTN|nr:hypothetical protein [Streptomyces bathyalis]QPP05186.1 hypothetical protein G4Z16_00925 [Streptomyces bathyalis]
MPRTDTRELESFAAALAEQLPGTWTSEYHHHTAYPEQFPIAKDLWDMGVVSAAVTAVVLGHDAVLTHQNGTRLYVIDHPGYDGEHLVGALAPPDIEPDALRGVGEPDGIIVTDHPVQAARDIASDLLPRYEQALSQVRQNTAHPAAPSRPAPAREAERVVMTWYGDGVIAAQAPGQEAATALHRNGFTWDPAELAFVLPAGDTAEQAHRVQAAGAQLAVLGIGVLMRHPPRDTDLTTTTPAPPAHQPAPIRGRTR